MPSIELLGPGSGGTEPGVASRRAMYLAKSRCVFGKKASDGKLKVKDRHDCMQLLLLQYQQSSSKNRLHALSQTSKLKGILQKRDVSILLTIYVDSSRISHS